MQTRLRIGCFIVLFIFCCGSLSRAASSFADLSSYEQELLTALLPEPSTALSQGDAFALLKEKGTRSTTYTCVGLLLRNARHDRANTNRLLQEVLAMQLVDPENSTHGIFRSGPASDTIDQNWREFIGVGLIVIRERFADLLIDEVAQKIDTALRITAEGASRRDVSPNYTNIAIMSAFLLDYVGHIAHHEEWIEQGIDKAKAITTQFNQHNTFSEYNSPTYYGVNLLGLSLWRELARSPEIRTMGKQVEADFWRDIGQFYHAGLKNMCGPYSRAYGMDMKKYPAILGLPIAMALPQPDMAPLPDTPTIRLYEWIYAPLFSILGVRIPDETLGQFNAFTTPRTLYRTVPHRRGEYTVSAELHPTWMMGAVTGMTRRWYQHCPAILHWRSKESQETYWLLVHGESGASAEIVDGAIIVTLPTVEEDHPLKLYLYAPGVALDSLTGSTWDLGGLQVDLETPLGIPQSQLYQDKTVGAVIQITWDVPAHFALKKVLVLRPRSSLP
jgi:hypothetical protein